MGMWEILWRINEQGITVINPIGWIILAVIVLAFTVILAGAVIWFLIRKFAWPQITAVLQDIKELAKQLAETNAKVRDLQEAANALRVADTTLFSDLMKQGEIAKNMTEYSASIVESMKKTCENMKELSIAAADKAQMVKDEVQIVRKEMAELRQDHKDLLKEHQMRHSGEIITITKPRKPKC